MLRFLCPNRFRYGDPIVLVDGDGKVRPRVRMPRGCVGSGFSKLAVMPPHCGHHTANPV